MKAMPETLAFGQHLELGRPFQEAVLVLDAHKPGRAGFHRRLCLPQLGRREVGTPDLAYLALGDQVGQGAESIAYRCSRVGHVQLVEVDIIGPQAPQAGFQSAFHVGRSGPALPLVQSGAELGRYQHVGAVLAQRPAQELLAFGAPVNVGGVEQVDTGIEGGLHYGGALAFVNATTKVVAAQAD